jgi:hypothetical protein
MKSHDGILITKEMVELWVGSDNQSVDDFLDLLVDLVNGTYPIELLKEDVLDYAKQEGELK